MSLDGFVTGPNPSREHGLGVGGGEHLHDWIWSAKTDADKAVLDELVESSGAIIMGRKSYDDVHGEGGWGEEGPLGKTPCFVLTHRPPERSEPVFTFVTDGIESAVAQAQAVAGDKNVHLHGATAPQQALRAGLLDEIQIHLIPILLGSGIRLFEDGVPFTDFELIRSISTPRATHLRYRVVSGPSGNG